MIRGATPSLPSGTGKDVRIAVFRRRRRGETAEAAGAESASWRRGPAAQIEGGMLDFDVTIANAGPDAAGRPTGQCSAPAARCPTPRPAPSRPTRPRLSRSSRAARSSTAPTATATCTSPSAKASFDAAALVANFRRHHRRADQRPSLAAKGRYIRKVTPARPWPGRAARRPPPRGLRPARRPEFGVGAGGPG